MDNRFMPFVTQVNVSLAIGKVFLILKVKDALPK